MLGPAALGSIIGYVGGRVLKKWQADDHVNFTFSIALAIGGYIIGDHVLHVSGVVTTVFTALLMVRTHKETFTGIGRLFNMYWDYLGFITNGILFFLIGIPMFSLFLLQSYNLWILIIMAPFAIVMISRAIVVWRKYSFTHSKCSSTTSMAKHSHFGGIERRNLRSIGVISSSRI
jgi:monovalent cation:H+ antiporter, CPA1 family